jgi:uracil DNA glycosylase superfamily protein
MDRSGRGPDCGAPATNVIAINQLLEDLAEARIGRTFNQYRQAGPNDVPGAPAIRLANLGHYLRQRHDAETVAVGEAAGYQGMRWSGIAFTSEHDLLDWGAPYQRTCRRGRAWSEPSGTIVHGLLRQQDAELQVILWNTVPTHPRSDGNELSNRHPTAAEIAAGQQLTENFLRVFQPRVLIAVGRVAEAALTALGRKAFYVRHPANGGGTRFREEMAKILAAELS